MTERMETSPAGYYFRDTIGVRIYHVGMAVLWTFLAAGAASAAVYLGVGIGTVAIDAAREPSQFASVQPTQTWGLVFLTLLSAIVAAGLIALAWQRLAAAVRPVPATYGPAPTGSAVIGRG